MKYKCYYAADCFEEAPYIDLLGHRYCWTHWEHIVGSDRRANLPDRPTENYGGLRYNEGKLRYDLLPADALEELVKVYTKGAAKYAPRNWEKGMDWSKCFASLLRHAFSWAKGEDLDPETGCAHMAHVAWNALALVAYAKRSKGLDDRKLVENI